MRRTGNAKTRREPAPGWRPAGHREAGRGSSPVGAAPSPPRTISADCPETGRAETAHRGYLIVPRNRQGMIDQMSGSGDGRNLLFVPFEPDEMAAVRGLLLEFERAFGFDADGRTAEQLIDSRTAPAALDLALARASRAVSPAERDAARKMAGALEAALDLGSYVEFAF